MAIAARRLWEVRKAEKEEVTVIQTHAMGMHRGGGIDTDSTAAVVVAVAV
jgi:hypothetical protein